MSDSYIEKTATFVKETLKNDPTGHDWWHVHRVWQMALSIAEKEEADQEVVSLIALLHDIADHKFHDGNQELAAKVSREWLESIDAPAETIERVVAGVDACSFSKGKAAPNLEAAIVQDADRLDALGTIGIARTFATGSSLGIPMYQPEKPKDDQATAVGHFYDKILKLKEGMNTQAAKELAEVRHQKVVAFLDDFYEEWSILESKNKI